MFDSRGRIYTYSKLYLFIFLESIESQLFKVKSRWFPGNDVIWCTYCMLSGNHLGFNIVFHSSYESRLNRGITW